MLGDSNRQVMLKGGVVVVFLGAFRLMLKANVEGAKHGLYSSKIGLKYTWLFRVQSSYLNFNEVQ